jgi:hypothetical protein
MLVLNTYVANVPEAMASTACAATSWLFGRIEHLATLEPD